jgi:nucleoside-diphosphate-sugar epimerase
MASVIYATGKPENTPLDESDWSDPTNPGMGMYPRSKYLAEKAAWDFHAALPEAERFELITILPGFILGPALRTESSVSIDFCRDVLTGKGSYSSQIPYRCFPVVDVRDVAQAHLNALKVP